MNHNPSRRLVHDLLLLIEGPRHEDLSSLGSQVRRVAAGPGRIPIKIVPAEDQAFGTLVEGSGTDRDLLREARLIFQAAAASGERISQRALARRLRAHGHQFSNGHLHGIAASIGLTQEEAA